MTPARRLKTRPCSERDAGSAPARGTQARRPSRTRSRRRLPPPRPRTRPGPLQHRSRSQTHTRPEGCRPSFRRVWKRSRTDRRPRSRRDRAHDGSRTRRKGLPSTRAVGSNPGGLNRGAHGSSPRLPPFGSRSNVALEEQPFRGARYTRDVLSGTKPRPRPKPPNGSSKPDRRRRVVSILRAPPATTLLRSGADGEIAGAGADPDVVPGLDPIVVRAPPVGPPAGAEPELVDRELRRTAPDVDPNRDAGRPDQLDVTGSPTDPDR